MDIISLGVAAKQKKRIERVIAQPDSTSGLLTLPNTIALGDTTTIPTGRTVVHPNLTVDGTLTLEGDGTLFVPSGSGVMSTELNVKASDGINAKVVAPAGMGIEKTVTLPAAGGLLINKDYTDSASVKGSYMTYGGTADAVTLTTLYGSPQTAYAIGQQFRFRATATNTGAMTINVDGLGVKTVNDIRNLATVTGEIRTDVDTVATYNGTNFIVDRQIERGSNANGEYVKFADGTLECTHELVGLAPTIAGGALYTSNALTWSYPMVFIVKPIISGDCSFASRWITISGATTAHTTISTDFVFLSTLSNTDLVPAYLSAVGRWK